MLYILATSAIAEDETTIVVEDEAVRQTQVLETSASVTVLEVDQTVAASTDVAGLVESATGTTVVRLGGLGDWSGVSIRGSTARQVQVHLDGIPLNPDGASTVNLSELPLQAFEQVEVWRGNAPPQFGAAPIGGVVNLVTGTPDDGELHGAAGSFGTWKLGGLVAAPLGDEVDGLFMADTFRTRGDFDYFADNATLYNTWDDSWKVRENNTTDQASLHGRLSFDTPLGEVDIVEAWLARDEGVPGHVNAEAAATSLETRRSLTALGLEHRGNGWQIDTRAWGSHRRELWADLDGEVGTGGQLGLTRLSSLGVLASGRYGLRLWLVPGVTVSGRVDHHRSEDRLADLESEASRRLHLDGALHADVLLWGERLTISPVLAGLWLDNRALGTVPFEDTPVAPAGEDTLLTATPRIGVLLRPLPSLALKANAGRYVRPPDFTELFGDRGTIIGNTELVPETGLHWDVGGRVEHDGEQLGVALDLGHYWLWSKDRIVLLQNSQRTSVPRNLGEAWIQGVEAALSLEIVGVVDSRSAVTRNVSVNMVRTRAYAGNQLPRVPTWEISQSTSLHWEERVRAGHTWSYTAGNYWDATNWHLAPPRNLHSVFLRVQPTPAWPSAELSVLNLFDRTVEVVPRNVLDETDTSRIVSPITNFVGYPLPGRTLLFSLRWAL
ncbi:MAG TPA: TonB-dependent receptor [Myxococcota bacterium]|nr:TonB-dependent receptor [Myxococcota bacterium]